MARTRYYKVSTLHDRMIGQDLVLGVAGGRQMPSILITEEQRRSMDLLDLVHDSAESYLSMSPVRFSTTKEMRELITKPKKTTPQWWRNFSETKHQWAAFEHSRALYSLFRGTDPSVFGVDTRWSRTRFFTFTFNFARLPNQPNILVDLAYSEFACDFCNGKPNRIHTTRYVLRPSLSTAVEAGDPTELQRQIPVEELPQKMDNFLGQSSADSPFVLFVYDYQTSRGVLGVRDGTAMLEEGLNFLLYPQRRQYDSRERANVADPRRPSQRPRRLSRVPHIHFVDVKDMTKWANSHYEDTPSLRRDAVRFGVKGVDIGKVNASVDSRMLMELWSQMSKGNYMKAQQRERAAEVMLKTMLPDGPSSTSVPELEGTVQSDDPNDHSYNLNLPEEKEETNMLHDYSDDESLENE